MGKLFEFLKQKLLVMELEVTTVKGRNQLQQERRELPELGFEKKTQKTKRTHEKQEAEGIYQARKTAHGKGRCLKQNSIFRELPWNCAGYREDFRERNNE